MGLADVIGIAEETEQESGVLNEDALEALLAARARIAQQVKELGEKLRSIDKELVDELDKRGTDEIVAGEWAAKVRRYTDRCTIPREWLASAVRDGVVTDTQLAKLLPANVQVNLRGYKLLEQQGVKHGGSKRPGSRRLEVTKHD